MAYSRHLIGKGLDTKNYPSPIVGANSRTLNAKPDRPNLAKNRRQRWLSITSALTLNADVNRYTCLRRPLTHNRYETPAIVSAASGACLNSYPNIQTAGGSKTDTGGFTDPEEANQEMAYTVSGNSTLDERRRDEVPLAAELKYDFRQPGA